jgi:hypothetical protein
VIVELDEQLFTEELADDALLLTILSFGKDGRFGIKTQPAFQRGASRPSNEWITRQSPNAAETAKRGFERGVRWKSYKLPEGREEPYVILEPREDSEWPTSFDKGPARLPLNPASQVFLSRRLELLLENRRSDGAFLRKVVPHWCVKRWERATRLEWLEETHCGGITEMRVVIEQIVAPDNHRRLRTWALFDCDGKEIGDESDQAKAVRMSCEDHEIPYHELRRRMIENYIPEPVMRSWANRIDSEICSETNKNKHLKAAADRLKEVEHYWSLPQKERHYYSLKRLGNIGQKNMGFEKVAQVWLDDDVKIMEKDLVADDWEDERTAIFQSLFASL